MACPRLMWSARPAPRSSSHVEILPCSSPRSSVSESRRSDRVAGAGLRWATRTATSSHMSAVSCPDRMLRPTSSARSQGGAPRPNESSRARAARVIRSLASRPGPRLMVLKEPLVDRTTMSSGPRRVLWVRIEAPVPSGRMPGASSWTGAPPGRSTSGGARPAAAYSMDPSRRSSTTTPTAVADSSGFRPACRSSPSRASTRVAPSQRNAQSRARSSAADSDAQGPWPTTSATMRPTRCPGRTQAPKVSPRCLGSCSVSAYCPARTRPGTTGRTRGICASVGEVMRRQSKVVAEWCVGTPLGNHRTPLHASGNTPSRSVTPPGRPAGRPAPVSACGRPGSG